MPDALTLRTRDALDVERGVAANYLGVVLLDDDDPVPDVPLVDEAPVPEPLMLPLVPVPLVLDELGLLMLPDELLGLVLEELLLDGGVLELVSVLEDELDEAGGVAGVTVVLLLLLLGGVAAGGITVVRSSFFSHPATPMPRATANALNNIILDFIGNSFHVMQGTKMNGSRRPFR